MGLFGIDAVFNKVLERWRTEDRGLMTEDRGQETDDR